jgi:3-oxoadipate enol-lactonase
LSERFQVLRYDLRGHGGTDSGEAGFTTADLGADLLALTQQLGWQRFSLCGLSIGALTAMEATLAAPDKVKSLALISAAMKIAPPPGGWAGRARQVLEQGMGPLADPMVERMFSASFRQNGKPAVEAMRSVFMKTDPRGYAACVVALDGADLTARIGDIQCPTVVIRGAEDMLLPPAMAQALADGLPNGRLVEVGGAHFPPLEDPAGVCRAMTAMMTS